ncbi:hypothetical protein BDM02DRAFT_322142 [Thelephora ganbajun]|uniref:Uncharacterized protein n=1 Tax=Thelephora ganbajun TaxID=370292 RepID=A0ACB6ZRF0_THEGA|nr:hypothetical protein BDM02DRAFT_322142 [Thelephora ganbajun]
MLNKPTKASRKSLDQNKHTKSATLQVAQHGALHRNRNFLSLPDRGTHLLDVPGESLTHITSYLDVPALLNLSRVNRILREHVDKDSTWYRALLCQFLGVSPESDLQRVQSLVLRRTEQTWKRELVYRHIISVRWERSRTSTITYSPLTGRISDIRLVSENSLLASSTHYGVVSRSNPLSGKVFRGFLDAAGTLNGLGIGNPNAEFSPNVCLCRIFTERTTAKILWGFTHGEVAVTAANKVADPSRTSAAKFSRSLISEQHNGTVTDAVWGRGGDVFLTAGIDGKVKLWDAVKMRCLWTSPVLQDVPSPTSYPSHIDFNSQKGIAVATFLGGEMSVWWGLSPFYIGDDVPQVNQVTIPLESPPPVPFTGISHLVLDTTSGTSLLVHLLGGAHFHRYNVNLVTGEVETIKFGETNGSIRSLKLVTAVQATAQPFVLVGDWVGTLSVYDWNVPHVQKRGPVQPVRQFPAFDDGDAVSSIEWNPWVMATGSSTGIVKVWDSLRFHLLRTFQPPTRGHTGDPSIVLEREMVVIVLGDKITTWKGGPVKKGNKIIRASKKGKNNALAKWRQQVDIYRDISESRREIEEEQSQKRAAYGREKDQLGSLEVLGLNEREALEYVLMLSRDEEERRDPSTEHRPTQSSSNVKVQASPRAKREVWSAGVVGSSGSPEMARPMSTGSDLSDEKEFPAVSESISSRGSGVNGIMTPVKSQRSNRSPPSAWSTPLKVSSKSGTASSKRFPATVSMSPSTSTSASKRGEREDWYEEQEDRDLKLAIELSLVEAAKK